jgi:hypothetical protein
VTTLLSTRKTFPLQGQKLPKVCVSGLGHEHGLRKVVQVGGPGLKEAAGVIHSALDHMVARCNVAGAARQLSIDDKQGGRGVSTGPRCAAQLDL